MSADGEANIIDAVLNWTDTYNSLVTAFGVLVTIAGFIWTLTQVYKAKSEATKAQTAISEIKDNLFRINAVAEFSEAISALQEVKRIQLQQSETWFSTNWMLILERLTTVRRILVQVRASEGLLRPEQQTKVQETITQIITVSGWVEKSFTAKQIPKNMVTLNRIISEQVDSLGAILTELKNIDWNKHV
jgi:hypothetical protein